MDVRHPQDAWHVTQLQSFHLPMRAEIIHVILICVGVCYVSSR